MVENKDSASDNASTGESWFVPRPARLLLDLPVTYRWEVTRRHPYYLRFWDLARLHLQQPSEDPVGHGLGQSAVLILQAIGVSADPPHPGTSAQDLGAFSLGKAWECGAV